MYGKAPTDEQRLIYIVKEFHLGIDTITSLISPENTRHTHGPWPLICEVCRQCDHSQRLDCEECGAY